MNTYYINGEFKTAAQILANKRVEILKHILNNITNNSIIREYIEEDMRYLYHSCFGDIKFYFDKDFHISFFNQPYEIVENKKEFAFISRIKNEYDKIYSIDDEIFVRELERKSIDIDFSSDAEKQLFYNKFLSVLKSLDFVKNNFLSGFFVDKNGNKLFYAKSELTFSNRFRTSRYCLVYDMNFVKVFKYEYHCYTNIYAGVECENKEEIKDYINNVFETKCVNRDIEISQRNTEYFNTSIKSVMSYKTND